MKRSICTALSAAFLVTGAFAAGSDSADKLHELGLFQGITPGVYDQESKALDLPATRVEGVTMLVRVLGREAEAQAVTAPCPFSDVPDWAAPYVTYSYENGLTAGTGNGLFGTADPLTLDQYTTMLLRAMGYEEGADFRWDAASAFALDQGVYPQGWTTAGSGDQITRGAMADASWFALNAPKKGSDETLLSGVVPNGDSQPAEGETLEAVRQNLLSRVNEARRAAGAPELVLNDALCGAAQLRAEELVEHYSHTRPDGRSCFTVLAEVGLESYRAVGENIAMGQLTSDEVMDGWMGSEGHRKNIENAQFTSLGVGYVAESNTWVQLFWTAME